MEKGKLYLVHKPQRLVDLLSQARKFNLEPKRIRFVYPTINNKPSIVLVEYVYYGGNEIDYQNIIEGIEINIDSKQVI